MLSMDGVLFCIFLLLASSQARPSPTTTSCPAEHEGSCVTEEISCDRPNVYCGEKRLVCKNIEVTITYYKVSCPKLEEFTFSYESYLTQKPRIVRFTRRFTNFEVGEQPVCDVTIQYTSYVTFDIIKTQYTQEFEFDLPTELEDIDVPVCIEHKVTRAPKIVELTYKYTVIQTEEPKRFKFSFVFNYTPPPNVQVYERKVEFTVSVSQAPVLEQTEFTYVVVLTKPPAKRTAVKQYSFAVTQRAVVKPYVFTVDVKYPGRPVFDQIVRRYSLYLTVAPHLVTYTDRFTYYVAQKPKVTRIPYNIEYYGTGAVIMKTDVCQFTYYPPAPLQTIPVYVSLTAYATLPLKLEEYTEPISAYVYGVSPRERKVIQYIRPQRLPPKLVTVGEFEYTNYVCEPEEATEVYIKYTCYVTNQPLVEYSVVPFTNYVYKLLTQCDAVFTFTSFVTKEPPKDVTYCVTVTTFIEGDVEKCEFVEEFTYYSTCEVYTKRIPIPYTTFVTKCP